MHGPRSYWRIRVASIIARLLKGSQHFLRARPHGDVFRQIHPTNSAGRINQKFGWTRNICTLRSRARMQHVVTPNHFSLRIGQKRKGIAELPALPLIDFRRVHADTDHANAARVELGKPFLKTPQLGVTERSPEPAIENQDRAFRTGKQISQRDRFVVLVRQSELGRFLSDPRRASRGWHLFQFKKNQVSE
jgi:hypothetical protein